VRNRTVAADAGEPPPLPGRDASAPLHDPRHPGSYARAGPKDSAIAQLGVIILGSHRDGSNLALEVCGISSPKIGNLPRVASLTGQSPWTVGIGLWHALWGVTSVLFIFYCLFAYLSYLSSGTHYDRL